VNGNGLGALLWFTSRRAHGNYESSKGPFRLLALFAQERKSGSILPQLNIVMRDYKDLVVSVQDMRFDLGLDQFKRGQLLTDEVERMIQEEAERRVQEKVQEAIRLTDEIFERNNIPRKLAEYRHAQNSPKETDVRAPEERYAHQR
jgi:hypothetical protein